MNGIKTEDMGSRKKYLAPLAVLIVCMLSLTGAAYAYSSTMTYQGNHITSDYISLDLNGAGETASDVVTGDNAESIFIFTDDFTYNGATKSDVIKYETQTGFIAKYKIKISGDAAFDSFNVTASSNLASYVPFANGPAAVSTKTMADFFTFTYEVKNADESATQITATALGTPTTITTQMVKDTTYVVIITATQITTNGINAGIVEEVANAKTGRNADDYETAIGNLTYTLTFNVTKS